MSPEAEVRGELFLLEEIVKSTPGVFRGCSPRRGLALHCDVHRKECAGITSVLVGDAFQYRLGALKTMAGIEMGALAAGMKF